MAPVTIGGSGDCCGVIATGVIRFIPWLGVREGISTTPLIRWILSTDTSTHQPSHMFWAKTLPMKSKTQVKEQRTALLSG
jgi:hypothetical protein